MKRTSLESLERWVDVLINQYRRERRKAMKAVVSEIYSPPRVTAAAKLLPEIKVFPGFALDLTTTVQMGGSGISMTL